MTKCSISLLRNVPGIISLLTKSSHSQPCSKYIVHDMCVYVWSVCVCVCVCVCVWGGGGGEGMGSCLLTNRNLDFAYSKANNEMKVGQQDSG